VELTLGLWGLPAVAATLMWITQLRYGPPPRHPATADETAATASHPAAPGRPAGPRLYRYPLAWQVTAFMGLQSLLYYAAVSWIPELFRDRGDSASTAGVLLAVMGLGNLLTSLLIPTLAHRFASQQSLVAPAVVLTAVGLAGALWAPLGSAVLWMLILGAAQGSSLGLGIFFTMARAPDPVTAASLSSLAQSVGYLVSAAGPLAVGFLRTATGSWTVPVVVLLVICVVELTVGLLAGRDQMVPARRNPGSPAATSDSLPADNR
jgi:CP family cyanate transporter-like MFS transporter